ncbi:MarR family winged helix-turn-helix transcriptional regulator [Streptomyces sp. NPDC050759]|uniref:MarR family winged helix-turn-helix transcriptional regulator n=1 Tax=Streptomyces sp. NPDC050759 TaxID=3365635 RepID=UPI0037A1C857
MDEVEELGLFLKAAVRESDRRVNEVLRPLGITASQAEVLQLLDRFGPMSLGELGSLVVAEGGHPSRLVDRMVQADLVVRQSAVDDRRRVELLPTERGRQLATQARELKEGFRDWVSGQIEDVDLAPVRAFFLAYLAGTELGETVRQRQSRSTRAQGCPTRSGA